MINLIHIHESPYVLSCVYTWEQNWDTCETIQIIAEGRNNGHTAAIGSASHYLGDAPIHFSLNDKLEEGVCYDLYCKWSDGTVLPEHQWTAPAISLPFSGIVKGRIIQQKQFWHLIEFTVSGQLPERCLGIKTNGVPLRLFPKLPENGRCMRYWVYSPSGNLAFEPLFPLKTITLEYDEKRGRN